MIAQEKVNFPLEILFAVSFDSPSFMYKKEKNIKAKTALSWRSEAFQGAFCFSVVGCLEVCLVGAEISQNSEESHVALSGIRRDRACWRHVAVHSRPGLIFLTVLTRMSPSLSVAHKVGHTAVSSLHFISGHWWKWKEDQLRRDRCWLQDLTNLWFQCHALLDSDPVGRMAKVPFCQSVGVTSHLGAWCLCCSSHTPPLSFASFLILEYFFLITSAMCCSTTGDIIFHSENRH